MQNEWEGNPVTLASYSSPSGDTFPSAQRAVAPLNPLNQPACGGPNLLNLGRTAALS